MLVGVFPYAKGWERGRQQAGRSRIVVIMRQDKQVHQKEMEMTTTTIRIWMLAMNGSGDKAHEEVSVRK